MVQKIYCNIMYEIHKQLKTPVVVYELSFLSKHFCMFVIIMRCKAACFVKSGSNRAPELNIYRPPHTWTAPGVRVGGYRNLLPSLCLYRSLTDLLYLCFKPVLYVGVVRVLFPHPSPTPADHTTAPQKINFTPSLH